MHKQRNEKKTVCPPPPKLGSWEKEKERRARPRAAIFTPAWSKVTDSVEAVLVEEVLASLCTLNKMSEEASKVRKYGSLLLPCFFLFWNLI